MSHWSNFLPKAVLMIALFAFLSFGSFGISHFTMSGMGGVSASGCPFMPGMTSVCKMNPLQHIAAWQSMFTSTAAQGVLTLILFLIFTAITLAQITQRRLYPEVRAPLWPHRLAFAFSRSPLQEAFSNGLIHSKVF